MYFYSHLITKDLSFIYFSLLRINFQNHDIKILTFTMSLHKTLLNITQTDRKDDRKMFIQALVIKIQIKQVNLHGPTIT